MSMSMDEIRVRYDRLNRKSGLTSRESAELALYEAVLFNGGKITVQRDYTPPKERKGAKLWDWF
jgi:hypothetical protein